METLTQQQLQDWDVSSRREWLVTNGIGGYGSASLAGANTRRYHGLLVAAANPPLGRVVTLSKLEEEVRVEDHLYLLSSNNYPSLTYPQGFRHLFSFSLDPVPTLTYEFHEGTVLFEKQIWMAHGKNTVYVRYTLHKAPESVKIGLVPFMAYKDYHTEQRRWAGFLGETTNAQDGSLTFRAFPDALPVHLQVTPANAYSFQPECGWFYNYEHEREEERGLDFIEDLYCPGRFDGILAVGKSVCFSATLETEPVVPVDQAFDEELARRHELVRIAGVDGNADPSLKALVLASDQFVIEKSQNVARATVIAGYPWFADWGRDTMIALPGLCLSTRRLETAREILSTFAGAVQDGLIPNRFSDTGGGAEFNTVDATLWFFHAAFLYARASNDWPFLTRELLPLFGTILNAHVQGTKYGIHLDQADGLLCAGEPGVQLTWMDAKVGDWVVTPRTGKPVEIQALWHNALSVMADLQRRAGQNADRFQALADQAHMSFAAKFVNPDGGYLYDVVDIPGQDKPDASLRPNQIFAISLPFPVIDPASETAKTIVETVTDKLFTPMGLRTLSPDDPNYKPHYGPGNQSVRDGAYHQGTVWPWLFGAYLDAHLAVYHDPAKTRELMTPLLESMQVYGVGTINEIFDGDAPYAPNGCIAQAWSVSEILRVLKHLAEK